MSTPDDQAPRLVRNITQYINRSLGEWYMFEPHLHWDAGVSVPDTWGAFMSVAVAHARVLVSNFQMPNDNAGLEKFLSVHCTEPFHFPRMPTAFAASAFLTKVTPAEWKAIADDLVMPQWLNSERLAWGLQQGLLFKAK